MKTKLTELIDFEKVDSLLEGFNKSTGFVAAIIDLNGNILSKSEWRQICSAFHRINPETSKKCEISDTELAVKLAGGEKYQFYTCLNGLVDVALPLVINGEHIANLFSGQFFFEEPDLMFFKKQALKYGFNEKHYLDALAKVPIVSKEKVLVAMDFLQSMTQLISETILQKLEQTELNKALKESEAEYRNLIELSPVAMSIIHNWKTVYFNPAAVQLFGAKTQNELIDRRLFELIHPDFHELAIENAKLLAEKGYINMQEQKYIKLDGSILEVETQAKIIRFNENPATLVIIKDITERKQSELLLQNKTEEIEVQNEELNQTNLELAEAIIRTEESQKLLSKIVENYPNSFVSVIEKDLTIGFSGGQKFKRQNLNPNDFSGLTIEQVFGENAPIVKDYYLKTFNGEQTTFELFINHQHQLYKTVPLYDEYGQISRILAVVENITHRRKAEEALRESEEKFREMANLLPQIVFESDNNGNLTYVNNNAFKTLGYPEDYPILGKSSLDFYTPDSRLKAIENIRQKVNKNEVTESNEYVMVRKDGSTFPALVYSNQIIKEGKPVGLRGIIININELKQSEEALKKSEERYRFLLENLEAGIVVHAPDTSIIMNNQRASEILGLSDDQLRGKVAIDPTWKFVHEDDTQLTYDEYPVNRIVKTRQPIKDQICGRYHSGKNDVVWATINGFPVLDNKGEIVEIVISFIEITERKNAERELLAAKEHAEESDRLKSAFLANMSHEIRTPMNGILGFAELLKEPGLNGEEQQEYIRIIEKSGARMLNIINEIVDISKIEAGLMKIEMQESNLNEQIEYIYTFFKPEVEAKGMKLSFNTTLPAKEATITTDREKLYAILINLVKNAIKYTKEGAIEFGYKTIETQCPRNIGAGIASPQCPASLQFYVKDTGIGIPKDGQEAIFERFVQADIADKMAYQGAGLGLSITKAYVEMLGGKIWVESNPDGTDGFQKEGNGSVFYFTLPYKTGLVKEPDIEQLVIEEKTDCVKKLKILIAEDDDVSAKLITINVNEFGKEILKAGTGVEAVETCRNNPDIDLILMDIQMPKMSGYEATRQIREFNKEVVIIAQTAFGLSGDREKAIEAGCNDYLSKPIRKNLLLEMINRYFIL